MRPIYEVSADSAKSTVEFTTKFLNSPFKWREEKISNQHKSSIFLINPKRRESIGTRPGLQNYRYYGCLNESSFHEFFQSKFFKKLNTLPRPRHEVYHSNNFLLTLRVS